MPQDWAEAVKWLWFAAEQGHAPAQGALGLRYCYGQGVPPDYVRALMWLSLAVSDMNGEWAKKLAEARDYVASQMTPPQIAEAERLAREWKPRTWDELPAR